jgi:hypothetical protein
VAEQYNFVDSRRDPMLNDRLDRGVRCVGEDSRYIDGLSIWRTPANMTAGKRYKRNWPRKVTSGLSDCSQAIESAQRSMSIAQRAGKPWRRQPEHRWIGRTVPALTSVPQARAGPISPAAPPAVHRDARPSSCGRRRAGRWFVNSAAPRPASFRPLRGSSCRARRE